MTDGKKNKLQINALKKRIKITEVEKQWKGKTVKPVSAVVQFAQFSDEDYKKYDEYYDTFDKQFNIKLNSEGEIYVSNGHITRKRKNGDYGYESILLTINDLPEFEAVYNHWKEISPKFVQLISHGSSMVGHTGTEYVFPDGSEHYHDVRDKKSKGLKITDGKSIDDKFASNGCKCISEHPYEQHYKNGRLDYYLQKYAISIEDVKTIQELEGWKTGINQSEIVLNFLKYVAGFSKPEDALAELLR